MIVRSAAVLLLSCAVVAPASAAVTLDYSLYTLGNYTEAGGSRIGGGVAVAGDAVINSARIGADLDAAKNGSPVVVVGGNLRYDNSTLSHGSVVYGGSNGSGQYTQASTPNGSFSQGPGLDFAGTSAGLLALSAGLGAQTATGGFSNLWGTGTLTGGSTAGVDVFNLSTSQLSSVHALSLIGTAGSKAIINVTGNDFSHYFNFNAGNYAVADVVFNFVDATAIGFGGQNLAASVLAPFASITQNGGNIQGSIVAGNYSSAGATIGGLGRFELADGGVAGAVPEPASWAMLIAGFGLVGAMMRRRQRVMAA